MSKSLLVLAMLLFAVVENASAQLPSFKLKNIEGKTVDTSTLSNDGKPFIISFFATWCKPCNRELSAIGEVYEDWVAETGVKLYAVSIDKAQNANKVKPLVNQHGWPYEVLLDSNSEFRNPACGWSASAASGCKVRPDGCTARGGSPRHRRAGCP